MYLCVYEYIYIYKYTYTYSTCCMFVRLGMCVRVCAFVWVGGACIYIHIYIDIYLCIYTYECMFLCIYIYICMHIHFRNYTYTYTHIHMYIHSHLYVYIYTFIYYLLPCTLHIYTYLYIHICMHYRVVAWCEMLQHPATFLKILRNTATHCNTPALWKYPNSIDMGDPPIHQAKNRSFLIAGVDTKYLYDAADGRYNFSKVSLATRFAM